MAKRYLNQSSLQKFMQYQIFGKDAGEGHLLEQGHFLELIQ